jgi:hypothetical protein
MIGDGVYETDYPWGYLNILKELDVSTGYGYCQG